MLEECMSSCVSRAGGRVYLKSWAIVVPGNDCEVKDAVVKKDKQAIIQIRRARLNDLALRGCHLKPKKDM